MAWLLAATTPIPFVSTAVQDPEIQDADRWDFVLRDRDQKPLSLTPQACMQGNVFMRHKKAAAASVRQWMQNMVARRRFTRLRLIRWIHAPYTVAPSQGTGPIGWNMAGNKPTDGSFWRPRTVAPPPEVLQSKQEHQEQGREGGSKR